MDAQAKGLVLIALFVGFLAVLAGIAAGVCVYFDPVLSQKLRQKLSRLVTPFLSCALLDALILALSVVLQALGQQTPEWVVTWLVWGRLWYLPLIGGLFGFVLSRRILATLTWGMAGVIGVLAAEIVTFPACVVLGAG